MFDVDAVAREAEAFVQEFMRREKSEDADEDHELLRFVRTSPVPKRIETRWDDVSRQWYWYWSRDDAERAPIEFDDTLQRYYWHWSESANGAWVPIDPINLQRLAERAKRLNKIPL